MVFKVYVVFEFRSIFQFWVSFFFYLMSEFFILVFGSLSFRFPIRFFCIILTESLISFHIVESIASRCFKYVSR